MGSFEICKDHVNMLLVPLPHQEEELEPRSDLGRLNMPTGFKGKDACSGHTETYSGC